MNVVQFSDSYLPVLDGVSQVVHQYVCNINQRHGRCWVVAPSAAEPFEDGPETIRCWSVPSRLIRKPYRLSIPTTDHKCRQALLALPVDIVHAHSPFGCGIEALRYARSQDVPLVATFHSKYRDDFRAAIKSEKIVELATQQVVWFYRQADEVWSVSESTADTLRSYGFQGEIRVMPNGSDMVMPKDAAAIRQAMRRTLALRDEDEVLLFVGQHIWQKNLRLILEGTALMRCAGRPIKLVLAGSGGDEEAIRELAAALGLSDCTRFMGLVREREALRGLYLAADLLTFPSLYDNAPLVVSEAASLGLPSLMIRGSNAAQRITDGKNGFLCENTPQSFTDAATRVLTGADLRRSVGEGARATLPIAWAGIVRDVVARYQGAIDHYASQPPGPRTLFRDILKRHE